jgi:hypothetical protein
MTLTSTALTFTAAARLAGIDKSTLRRAVKAGKLSAARDAHGIWHIEACEMERLYPLDVPGKERPEADPEAVPRHAAPDAAVDTLVSELRAVISDLRQDRDSWREQAQRLALPAPAQSKRRWWQRRAG